MSKEEHLRFIISRYDNYYNGVNTKSAFFISFNTFISGGIVTGYYGLITSKNIHFSFIETCIFLIPVLCGFISTTLILLAVNPFLKSGNCPMRYRSHIFFGSVAETPLKEYEDEIEKQTDDDRIKDLTKQTHQLSIGLTRKFRFIRIATNFILAEFLFLIPLLILIFKHL